MPAHLALYWRAFAALSSDRPLGFSGAGAIPWTAIDRYAERLGLGGDEFERFAEILGRLDAAWLERAEKKREAARREAEAKARRRR